MAQEQIQFQCTGDCLKCFPAQRQYCAAQHAYSSMLMLRTMQDSLNVMRGTVEELREKINAIQNNEALVFSTGEDSGIPTVHIAQGGDGAKE